jgi:hypothetical protein
VASRIMTRLSADAPGVYTWSFWVANLVTSSNSRQVVGGVRQSDASADFGWGDNSWSCSLLDDFLCRGRLPNGVSARLMKHDRCPSEGLLERCRCLGSGSMLDDAGRCWTMLAFEAGGGWCSGLLNGCVCLCGGASRADWRSDSRRRMACPTGTDSTWLKRSHRWNG